MKSNMLMFDFKARCVSQTFHCVPEQPTNASPAGPTTIRYHRNGILPYLPGKIRLSLFILDKTRLNRTYRKEPKRIRRKEQENRYKKSTQYTIPPTKRTKRNSFFHRLFLRKETNVSYAKGVKNRIRTVKTYTVYEADLPFSCTKTSNFVHVNAKNVHF